jgi:hypothetical protein
MDLDPSTSTITFGPTRLPREVTTMGRRIAASSATTAIAPVAAMPNAARCPRPARRLRASSTMSSAKPSVATTQAVMT